MILFHLQSSLPFYARTRDELPTEILLVVQNEIVKKAHNQLKASSEFCTLLLAILIKITISECILK